MSENQSKSSVIIYTDKGGDIKLRVKIEDETVWLTQKLMAELFDVDVRTISEHLINIYLERELDEVSTIRNFRIVQKESSREVTRDTKHYNLDVILAVGYRVRSEQGIQFRKWATERLREYLIKGFTMDDERLKNPQNIFGKDYFEEQLARIRDIRSSERRFYQKITDIYAQCSADYDSNNEMTKKFFAIVQNKLHWAISKQTAAEIIYSRVDSNKTNMGLTNWKNSPKGKIRKTDVVIAKNYLTEKELDRLNRMVSFYLDFAEMQAQRGIMMYMKDWIKKLDDFITLNEADILQDNGKISHETATTLAESEFNKYSIIQDKVFESDFDREVKKILGAQKETGRKVSKNKK